MWEGLLDAFGTIGHSSVNLVVDINVAMISAFDSIIPLNHNHKYSLFRDRGFLYTFIAGYKSIRYYAARYKRRHG